VSLKKVGSVETWVTGEIDHSFCREERAVVMEKGRQRGAHKKNEQRECFPTIIGLENESG